MLAADPNIATADCEVLVTGLAQDGTASWRRPDVLAVTTGGQPDHSSNSSPRDWSFLLQRIAAKDSGVSSRIETCSVENRTLLNQALHAIVADPLRSQKLWAKWAPLLHRLFPRLA